MGDSYKIYNTNHSILDSEHIYFMNTYTYSSYYYYFSRIHEVDTYSIITSNENEKIVLNFV